MMDARNPAAGWPKAVIFDLDGTLVDSAPDIAASLNKVMDARGFPAFDIETVKNMIGGGVPKLIERAFVAHGIPADDLNPIVADMVADYAARATQETRPYPGAEALIAELAARGIVLGLCTNKVQGVTDIIMRDLGLAPHFASVVGARDGVARKPEAEPMLMCCAEMGVAPADTVMLGDSHADAGAARAAGTALVLVSYGYTRTPASELGADAVIDTLAEFPAALDRLAAARATV